MEGQESKREWVCTMPQRPRIRMDMFSHVPRYWPEQVTEGGRFHSFMKRAINSHFKGRVGKWSHFCNSPSVVTEAKHFWFVGFLLVMFFVCFLLFNCSMWDFGSPTRDWTRAHCIEVQSLNHWTARKVPPFAWNEYVEGHQKTLNWTYFFFLCRQ